MKTIRDALEILATKKAKKINEKYNGNKELYIEKVLEGILSGIGNEWQKEDIKRIYFNEYNCFYDYDTKALEPIYSRKELNYDDFSKKVIKHIEAE